MKILVINGGAITSAIMEAFKLPPSYKFERLLATGNTRLSLKCTVYVVTV